MDKFKVGKKYSTRSVCNHECVFTIEIVRRTAKSVWAVIDGVVQRRAIKMYDGSEYIMPFGTYSMAPIIRARG